MLLLASRIATKLVETDLDIAVTVFESTMRVTSIEDPLYRERVLDWMRASIRQKPASRKETLAKHAALFTAGDCPEALRAAFEQLRSSN